MGRSISRYNVKTRAAATDGPLVAWVTRGREVIAARQYRRKGVGVYMPARLASCRVEGGLAVYGMGHNMPMPQLVFMLGKTSR